MIAAAGFVAHHAEEVVHPIGLVGVTRRGKYQPLAMEQSLLVAEAHIDVRADCDLPVLTRLNQPAQHVILQGRMADADLGVIIRHAKAASGVEDNVINAAPFDAIGESVGVEVRAHVRARRHGVNVVDKAPFRFVHDRYLRSGREKRQLQRALTPSMTARPAAMLVPCQRSSD